MFDPTNYAQNVMTAANTLQQINNQITSLQNEARMLINQAKQSRQSSLFVAANHPAIDRANPAACCNQAQRIAYDVQQIDQAFSTHYGAASVSASSASLIDGARAALAEFARRLSRTRCAFRPASCRAIETARSEAERAVSSSQSAVGALQASQAGNQLLALQSKQLADVTALLASQGRAQSLEMARQAEAQEQAREQMRRFIAPGQGYQPGNVAMFH